ncbi:MAG: hypothetical protein ACYC9S_08965 [Leptospirales bacterium]
MTVGKKYDHIFEIKAIEDQSCPAWLSGDRFICHIERKYGDMHGIGGPCTLEEIPELVNMAVKAFWGDSGLDVKFRPPTESNVLFNVVPEAGITADDFFSKLAAGPARKKKPPRRKEKPYSFFVERVQSMDHYKVRLCVLTRDGAGFYEVSPPVRVDHWSGIADGFLRIMIEAEPHLKGRKLPDITSGNTEKIDQNTWKDFTLEEKFLKDSLKAAMQAWEKRQGTRTNTRAEKCPDCEYKTTDPEKLQRHREKYCPGRKNRKIRRKFQKAQYDPSSAESMLAAATCPYCFNNNIVELLSAKASRCRVLECCAHFSGWVLSKGEENHVSFDFQEDPSKVILLGKTCTKRHPHSGYHFEEGARELRVVSVPMEKDQSGQLHFVMEAIA